MLNNFTSDEFDIIIQAGQSNADGTGFGDASEPYIPKENVLYLNSDFTIFTACERVNGNNIQGDFSLSFADNYINNNMLDKNRKLLILRAAVGGTGFLDNRWGKTDDLFINMMEMIKTALSLNPNNSLIALLWHQGETDAILKASYETHYSNLFRLVDSVKKEFNYLDLPFIAGDFVKQWKDENSKDCEPVIRAIKDVCKNCKNGAFVTTDELLSNSQTYECDDIIHFSREALYKLGTKYFNAFKQVF